MTDLRLGPPRVFVPVCKDPCGYQITMGPLGYEEVEEAVECPLLVEPQKCEAAEAAKKELP